jgi:predicted secreted protein
MYSVRTLVALLAMGTLITTSGAVFAEAFPKDSPEASAKAAAKAGKHERAGGRHAKDRKDEKSPAETDPTMPALPKGLLASTSYAGAQGMLGASSAQASPRILLEVPDIYDRKSAIPVRIRAAMPSVEMIVLLHERSARPVLAAFAMRPVQDPEVSFNISVLKTGVVRALVKSEGRWLYAEKSLRLATESWK